MAGVTTASRMSLGAVASSEALNPEAGSGFIASGGGSGDYWISNLTSGNGANFHDLEIWFKASNQSTWTTWWAFTLGTGGQSGQSSKMYNSYFYRGYSSGTSQGSGFGSYAYNYPCGYSSYGHTYRLYLSNFTSQSNIKSWHGFGGYTNGSATSYVTCQQGGGTIREANPITEIFIQTGYGNGSAGYMDWTAIGRRPK